MNYNGGILSFVDKKSDNEIDLDSDEILISPMKFSCSNNNLNFQTTFNLKVQLTRI